MAITWKKLAYESDVILKSLLTAEGDIIYASGVATPVVLAAGDEADVLTIASGIPSWAPPGPPAAHALNSHSVPTGAVDFDLKEATDLIVMNVANEAALPVGAGTVKVGQLCCALSEKTLHMCTVEV